MLGLFVQDRSRITHSWRPIIRKTFVCLDISDFIQKLLVECGKGEGPLPDGQ